MLQSVPHHQPVLYDDHGQSFDLAYFIDLLKRRILYFAVPFMLVFTIGATIVEIQRPIYRAEGKILVESPEIPPDLVRPTVTELADARIQVIQQRIMTRDNLLGIVNKYKLFPREQAWMSGTELLDLMRNRVEIKPVALETQRPNNPAIAFTLSFDYEVPDLARRVANDFLTAILSEDASARTSSASETTKFLEREVKRLEGEHDAIVSQIEALKRRPPPPEETISEELKAKTKTLAELESTLVQKSSVYSDEYPEVKSLKKKVAALKRDIAAAPQKTHVADNQSSDDAVNATVLARQETNIARSLDETNRKLTAARLGESMERGQEAERLEVIEHPSLPQKPVRPKKVKWFAAAFAVAAMIGAGSLGAAEMLDRRIRGSRELMGIIDGDLIVTVPYVATPGEERRKRRNFILICIALLAVFAGAIAVALNLGVSVDFLSFDRSWLDALTRLLK